MAVGDTLSLGETTVFGALTKTMRPGWLARAAFVFALLAVSAQGWVSASFDRCRWKTIALVTSNYDTRSAGMIWRKTLFKQDPSVQVAVEGVADPQYQPRGWWRQPGYAKVWLMEVTKLVGAIG